VENYRRARAKCKMDGLGHMPEWVGRDLRAYSRMENNENTTLSEGDMLPICQFYQLYLKAR